MTVSKHQAMRPAEIELIDAVNANEQATEDLTTKVDAEVERAKKAEGDLQATLDTATQVTTALEGLPVRKGTAPVGGTTAPAYQSALIEGSIDGEDVNIAGGPYCHAEGYKTKANGYASHAEGQGSETSASYAHAEGYQCLATEPAAHAEGYLCQALGKYSHAGGYGSHTNNKGCGWAFGWLCVATGEIAHAEGQCTEASGNVSHAEGYSCKATKTFSHAEGNHCVADENYSHAEGQYTHTVTPTSDYWLDSQHVQGKWNNYTDETHSPLTTSNLAHIVGGGDLSTRKNIHEVDWDGNGWYLGDVKCGDATSTTGVASLREAYDHRLTEGSVTTEMLGQAAVNTDNINDQAVTTDKILNSAVTMGKLDMPIQTLLQTLPAIEFGTSNSIDVPAESHVVVDVTFPTVKTEAPLVFTSLQQASADTVLIANVQSVTNEQTSIVITNPGTVDVTGATLDWLAVSGR